MKKLSIMITGIFFALFIMVSVSAAGTITGADATIADSGSGPGIDNIDLSPNVSINYSGAANEFEMCSVNSKGIIEYGVASGDTNVYMQEATVADGTATVTVLTTTDGATVSTWTAMGGS